MNDDVAGAIRRVLHPKLVVVSGQAGSGKTTLAHHLASVVGCPAICRDEIKEGMVHAHGTGFEAASGDPLTQLTYPLFFDVVRLLLEGGVTVVAEAAFQHPAWERGLTPLSLLAKIRVVRCSTTNEEMRRRRHRRMAEVATRAAHADKAPEFASKAPQAWDAIHFDAPILDVDTSHGYTPDLHEIAAFVNAP